MFAGKRDTWAKLPDWTVRDAKLARADKSKYLGVEVHCTQGIQFAVQQRLSRMVSAQSAELFDVIVAASGSYGCEIWSTPFLGEWHLWDCPQQRQQAATHKHLLGVKRSTGNLLV